ncbi:LysR family transcriptional regulator [Rhizobium sp. CNPSo 4039]|uniref:LysR family transcriptional regulator n=1 Tax=Rhizobium sp. CNPSo 4039 TaxID=3021409 RepID=UPI00254B9638|nr:LysR family transcriptional regulator [Rhizobium sp. CNPSo 4039]MDK4716009.1 LysR family transcriptional regulator [Rhizobium sp. CNPSo 4039]
MQLDDIRAFERIAASGSLSDAARKHGIPKSSLSHGLRRLEVELGAALFERRGSRLILTEEGHGFLSHARDVVRACERAEDAVRTKRLGSTLKLRVGTTDELGTNLMAPMCLQYLRRNDEVSFDLAVLNKVDLFHRDAGLDCIIFAGPPPEDEAKNLIHRRIARYVSCLYASPDYISQNGIPANIDELRHHPLIENRAAGGTGAWSIASEHERVIIHPNGRTSTNDNWLAKLSVIQGMGIGFFPEWFTIEEVRAGILAPVLPEWSSDAVSVGIYYHAHRFSNPQIKAFVTFLATQFHGFYRFPYREEDFDMGGIKLF